jgi:hypothetical protein
MMLRFAYLAGCDSAGVSPTLGRQISASTLLKDSAARIVISAATTAFPAFHGRRLSPTPVDWRLTAPSGYRRVLEGDVSALRPRDENLDVCHDFRTTGTQTAADHSGLFEEPRLEDLGAGVPAIT